MTNEEAIKVLDEIRQLANYPKEVAKRLSEYLQLEKEIDDWYNTMGIPITADALKETARHFAEWGAIHLNARKEE